MAQIKYTHTNLALSSIAAEAKKKRAINRQCNLLKDIYILLGIMKKKILILDDKETIAKVLSIYLMSDYDVQWLPDGIQGVKWLQNGNSPDLIISDIRMPGMRGDDFLEWIKQNELYSNIPVIMLSSEDSTSERIRLLEIGAVDYIVKPFNPMELKIRVKKILND